MKKILTLILAIIMTTVMALTGCSFVIPDGSKDDTSKADVKLMSLSAALPGQTIHTFTSEVKLAAGDESEGTDETNSGSEEGAGAETGSGETTDPTDPGEGGTDSGSTGGDSGETTDPGEGTTPGTEIEEGPTQEITNQYIIIYKSQTIIEFTIQLSNPKNFYIMDFRLSCEEENVEIKQGSHWQNINDENTYVRWDEASDRIGNHQATFELKLPNPETSPNNIRVKDMYYSSRTDGGGNKTAVNMNDKENYTVYKVEDDLVTTETVMNRPEIVFKKADGSLVPETAAYVFKLNTKEGVNITKFTCAGMSPMNISETEKTYLMQTDGKIEIEYELNLGDVTYTSKYEKDITLCKITNRNGKITYPGFTNNEFEFGACITGTDTDKISLKDYDCFGYTYIKNTTFTCHIRDIKDMEGNPVSVINNEEWLKSTDVIIAGVEYNIYYMFGAGKLD